MEISSILMICAVILGAAAVILMVLLIIKSGRSNSGREQKEMLSGIKNEITSEIRSNRAESDRATRETIKTISDVLVENQRQISAIQDKRLGEMNDSLNQKQELLQRAVNDRLTAVDERFKAFTEQNTALLEGIRTTMQNRLASMQEDNTKQLEQMRLTVDEKLQKSLDERLTQSFKQVSDRLQEVYTGLGEMKNLASGVGDLKKVLSNVKSRGILGELQLGAILEEIMPREQYEENVVTVPGSRNPVEFAIKLPGSDDGTVLLPIDSKFPADTYRHLVDAYDSGDKDAVDAAYKALETCIKNNAKDIRDKYIKPPYTTEFAIMFLPFEGLYAEVVRRGLIETLQRDFKVNIAGPTTIAALLNSLQMGFRTLAIQKRSGEVWKILEAVKTEFVTFDSVLASAQKRITQTSEELDKLIGVRTRQINRKLKDVSLLPTEESTELIESDE